MTRRATPQRRAVVPGEQLSAAQVRGVLVELANRKRSKRSIDFRRVCFPRQLAMVTDPAPLVAASCSRRAGKSWGFAYKMLDVAQRHRHSTVLYLTNTKPQAKRIIWGVIERLDDELELKGKFNQVELSYRLPNGSYIRLGGCNDEFEIERYRGPAYPLVVIDEAQSIRSFLKYLIFDVLRPATIDYRGQIMLGGTPNAACLGYFRDAVKGTEKGWSVHSWTLRDNPNLEDVEDWLAEHRKLVGITEQDPKYRREYGGEWVRDSASQVYQITEGNLIDVFPRELATDWEYVLGVDLGFVGVSAFVVLAYSVTAGKIVVVESKQITPAHFGPDEKLLTPEMLAGAIEGYRERYDFASIVVDPGGLGAKFIEDIRRRFQIPAIAAEKQAKLGAIELLNGDLRAKRMLVVEPANADLIHDAALLEWNWDRVDKGKHGGEVQRSELMIDDRTPDHLTDALTYAHRRCRAYFHEPAGGSGPPRRGTAEHEDWVDRERDRRIIEASRETEGREWWAREPGDESYMEAI